MGGMLKAIESGFVAREIQESSLRYQKAVDSGEKVIVGLNKFQDTEEEAEPAVFEIDPQVEPRQRAKLAALKARRDGRAVETILAKLAAAIERNENLMPVLIDAARSYASVGEITEVMRRAWGEYRNPVHL